ncbi:hypothetical protein ACFYWY_37625 [Streptomyces sp. NPDC002870]|uniref:hypothetical protein n=1 Tax=Streptomyces sp. NPDC002870 TaxID=3364666 RepID=UPI0036D083EF
MEPFGRHGQFPYDEYAQAGAKWILVRFSQAHQADGASGRERPNARSAASRASMAPASSEAASGLLADRLARLGSGAVVLGGSGLTGTESAAEIAERHPELNVALLGRQEPGATMNPKAKAYLQAALERLGVRVRSGIEVVKVLPDSVELAGGALPPMPSCGPDVDLEARPSDIASDGGMPQVARSAGCR